MMSGGVIVGLGIQGSTQKKPAVFTVISVVVVVVSDNTE